MSERSKNYFGKIAKLLTLNYFATIGFINFNLNIYLIVIIVKSKSS